MWKELTTPDDPARGVIAGIEALLHQESIPARDIGRVVHATTLFTNALIERKGAKTGLVTTEGFGDILQIGRERKYELYDIFIEMPRSLIPRRLCREVPERLSEAGEVEVPLDIDALLREVDALVAEDVESIAVVFLHSYANGVHEQTALKTMADRYPSLSLTASHDVAPEIGEYERASTTVANAYVKPLAQRYLHRLAAQLKDLGIDAPFFPMLSNGGLTHIEEAKRTPVQLLESGPSAGALAGAHFGAASGEDKVLAFDMGGTTAKASLVDGGEPLIAYRFEAAREKRFMKGSGLPIKTSTIELIEVGAGGGSIAHIDELGLLRVGPRSAGAVPGPACYGRGGTQPTVTDADLLLGYLNADFFLGGAMKIDLGAAEAAMQSLTAKTGLSLTEVAWGIHDVVNENMASAARVHIAERGRDPRQYALLAMGGAGPVHAYNVARKLNMRRVICPAAAGVGSTIGLLMAPARIDRVATMLSSLESLDWEKCEGLYRALEDDAARVLSESGAEMSRVSVRRSADMRYAGQASEIVVDLPAGPYADDSRAVIEAAFERVYKRLFVRTRSDVAVQMVSLRVSLVAPVRGGGMAFKVGAAGAGRAALKGRRSVFFAEQGEFVETPVYDRGLIPVGEALSGPAVIEERESTLVTGPASTCHLRPDGSLIISVPAED